METDGTASNDELVENEYYIVRHSGETPEIAYNSAIYFLERAKDGPVIELTPAQRQLLQTAAVDRCEEIIVRDMFHANVGTSIYRGIVRSICNYERFIKFCNRQNLDPEAVKRNVAPIYSTFLERELHNISNGDAPTVINCTFIELREFAITLGVEFPPEYQLFQAHCPQSA